MEYEEERRGNGEKSRRDERRGRESEEYTARLVELTANRATYVAIQRLTTPRDLSFPSVVPSVIIDEERDPTMR